MKAHILQNSLGVYCYTMMPFGLKNAGATYQRSMNAIFHEHIGKTVECYVDNITMKSHNKSDHLADLKRVFDIMQAYQLKMNPTKSFLRVSSSKFLEFFVTSKGIHLDLERVCTIQEMQPSRNFKELRGLQGRLAYIQRFISNLSGRCQPFTKLMKSHSLGIVLANKHSKRSKNISHPLVVVAQVLGKPFLLYVRPMDHFLGALLAQNNEQNYE